MSSLLFVKDPIDEESMEFMRESNCEDCPNNGDCDDKCQAKNVKAEEKEVEVKVEEVKAEEKVEVKTDEKVEVKAEDIIEQVEKVISECVVLLEEKAEEEKEEKVPVKPFSFLGYFQRMFPICK